MRIHTREIDKFLTTYLREGLLHRDDDLPAVVGHNRGRYQQWFQEGRCHRDGGPAYVLGRQRQWWTRGVLIREIFLDDW